MSSDFYVRKTALDWRVGLEKVVGIDADRIVQDLCERFAAPLPDFYKRRTYSSAMKSRNSSLY